MEGRMASERIVIDEMKLSVIENAVAKLPMELSGPFPIEMAADWVR